MKRSILFFLLLIICPISAQTNLMVNTDDPVYHFLEVAELKGLIHSVSLVRPFSRVLVREYLQEIGRQRTGLTSGEQEILDQLLRRFRVTEESRQANSEQSVLETGSFSFARDTDFPFVLRAEVFSEQRIDLNNTENRQTDNFLTLFLEGDLHQWISYSLGAGGGLASLNSETFVPFSFQTRSDGFNINWDTAKINQGESGITLSQLVSSEMTANLFDNRLRLTWGRFRRNIGAGDSNLILSEEARPYDAIELSFRPFDWLSYYYSFGSLGDWFAEGDAAPATYPGSDGTLPATYSADQLSQQKMLTVQTLELFPFDWITLNITFGAVWGKRFEISYLNPLMPLMLVQNLYGDLDNMAAAVSGHLLLPGNLKLHASFFADEIQLNNVAEFFYEPRQQFAFQAGIKGIVPWLPLTTLGFQYTKIEPYTYTHYGQHYPGYTVAIDTSWTHDGSNLGYPLPPNSDEFKLRLISQPLSILSLMFQYQFIRHGHGNYNSGEMEGTVTSGGINGEDAHMGNTSGTKSFLNDAPYEFIHVGQIQLRFRPESLPFVVTGGYAFSHSQDDGLYDNIGHSGVQHLISLEVRVFPEF